MSALHILREQRFAMPSDEEVPAEDDEMVDHIADDERWNIETSPRTQGEAPTLETLFDLTGGEFAAVVEEYQTAVGIPLDQLSTHALIALHYAVKSELSERLNWGGM